MSDASKACQQLVKQQLVVDKQLFHVQCLFSKQVHNAYSIQHARAHTACFSFPQEKCGAHIGVRGHICREYEGLTVEIGLAYEEFVLARW